MDWKSKVAEAMKQQELDVARGAVKEALKSSSDGQQSMRQVLAELQEDPRLWKAFESLTLRELREALAPKVVAAPGPDRRRGVTSNRIIDFVKENSGCSLGRIAKALGLGRGAVTSQLRKLRSESRLRVEGRERRYRYYAE